MFYQLAVSRRAGCVCALLQSLAWCYCYVGALFVVWDAARFLRWLAFTFAAAFWLWYREAEGRVLRGGYSFFLRQRRRERGGRNGRGDHPWLELFGFVVRDLYGRGSLAAGKAALIGEPRLLVLDEPTNGVDTLGILTLKNYIGAARERGCVVAVSSHVLDFADRICDVGIFLKNGKIAAVKRNNGQWETVYRGLYLEEGS